MMARQPQPDQQHRQRGIVSGLLCGLLCAAATLPARADDLLGIYREALRADATLQAARADTEAQRERLPQARAQLLPNLSLSGSKSKNTTEQTSQAQFGTYTNEYDYDSHNYVLALRQPLFRPHTLALYAQSKAQVRSADATLEQAFQEIAVRVCSAYFDVLLAQAEVDVNEAQQEAYRSRMDYAQKAFIAGSGTRTDIDEARSRLDLAEAQASELQYHLEYLQDTLAAIVGRRLTPLATLSPERLPLQPPDPARLEEWVQTAENINPQLKSLRADVEAAEKEIWKARAGHLPTADLIAQRSKSESENNTSIGNQYDTRMIGVQISIPLFSGGYVNSSVRQAIAELEKQRQQLEAARRDIRLQVKKEFDAATQGIHWVSAYTQAVKSAEQTLYSTRKGFQAGTRNNLDILNAEQNLATARRDLYRSRYQYILARLKLLALVGRLNDDAMQQANAWLEPDGH
ncbi:MAG: TolC family outer membrane protein [Zoogloeaceae bacterium]|jgi:outer membrane protein/protease secretion system outer membrane protein|nr:TolC family outer membrane protein [Zoogloeaceae bacterium]